MSGPNARKPKCFKYKYTTIKNPKCYTLWENQSKRCNNKARNCSVEGNSRILLFFGKRLCKLESNFNELH